MYYRYTFELLVCSIFVYGVISVEKVDLISLRKLNERCSAGRQKDAQLASFSV